MRSTIARFAVRRRGNVVAALIPVLILAGTAIAGTGRNANLQLGVVNTVNGYLTTLKGSFTGPMLQVTNTGTGRGIGITVAAGKAPIYVNAGAGRAVNLDADKLDGKTSAAFQQRVSGTCGAGSAVNLVNVNGTVGCTDLVTNATDATNAGNADTLGGYEANGLTRVAYSAGLGVTAPATGTEIPALTLSITAPAAGFVLVNADQNFNSIDCTASCTGFARLRHVESDTFGQWSIATLQSSLNTWEVSSMTGVFSVAAGTNTFQIRVSREPGSDGTIRAHYNQMTALYSPFGSTGGGTLGASPALGSEANPARP